MGSSQSTQAARREGRKIATVTRAISTGSAQAATRVSREGSSRDLAGSAGPSAATAQGGRGRGRGGRRGPSGAPGGGGKDHHHPVYGGGREPVKERRPGRPGVTAR